MAPKVGRPKAENPLNASIKIRMDKQTMESLTEYCAEHNITRTEAIRQGIKLLLDKK